MKAAVYHDRRDVRVEDIEEPSGPADGQVLVAPLWCGICGTDVHEYTDGPIVTPVDAHTESVSIPRSCPAMNAWAWRSTSPGATYAPDTSTTSRALSRGIAASTAAT